MKRLKLHKLITMTGLLVANHSAMAAYTSSGTVITNQALGTYQSVNGGGTTSVYSNVVSATVTDLCSVSVSANQVSSAILPGETAALGFTVVNTGNSTFTLPVSVSTSGTTPAPTLSLYLDANGNGVVDAGEKEITSLNLKADEAAKVIALVKTDFSAKGDALATLVASCGQVGAASASAKSTAVVNPPPVLAVKKSFSPTLVKPGATTEVGISATNNGKGVSREVILSDDITQEIDLGLSYVMGSARTNKGVLEYTNDGVIWSTQEVSPVRGIRVRVDKLQPGESVNLNFTMLAAVSADGKKIKNTAVVNTAGQEARDTVEADVRYLPAVAIGPLGTPEASEGSEADKQSKALAVVGQTVCFDHTVKNTGDVADNFVITISYPQGGASSTLYGADGRALPNPLKLEPNQSETVKICYIPSKAGPLETLITVKGDRGESNTTKDLVTKVEAILPELKKSYTATAKDGTAIQNGGSVAVGDTITYTLEVRNPYDRALAGVVITDPIASHLNFKSASDNGQLSGVEGSEVVSWNIGTLAAGEVRKLTITAVVSSRAIDGELVKNTFNMVSTDFPSPVNSNTVETAVWDAAILITKEVSAAVVTYGDRVTYTLRIKNTSQTTQVDGTIVDDKPDKGLLYIPSTSTLGGKALVDPVITPDATNARRNIMNWNVGTIPANGEIVISYDMRVTNEAPENLNNIVVAKAIAAGGAAKAVASNESKKAIKIDPLKFAPLSDLIGTVFIDSNRNGIFDREIDTPVERARVILSNGRLALTDTKGRYHFSNVDNGTWAVRLDPNTTPYPPLVRPQEGGLEGTQTVHVRGLTSVDFPLEPLAGDIQAIRRTTLQVGQLTVEKSVFVAQGGYVVSIKLNTPSALSGLSLNDPLPVGATLKEGSNTLQGSLPAGETKITYRFDWSGEPNAATTDPFVSWRY